MSKNYTSQIEYEYLLLLRKILNTGVQKGDRTGTGTLSLFGHQMRCDLNEGFPLLTTKRVAFKAIAHELLWFLSGSTNIDYLKKNGVKIWNEWADENGELGPVYGHQWRRFGERSGLHGGNKAIEEKGFDQISWLINEIKTNPNSRRLIVTGWNPKEMDMVKLPPCHTLFQFYVLEGKLSCQLYQRSADVFLGVPFNIASYALLTQMIAQVCDLKLGEFVHTFGDVHIYNNHIDQVKEQLTRDPRKLPTLNISNQVKNIDEFTIEDFELVGYDPHPTIKGEVSV